MLSRTKGLAQVRSLVRELRSHMVCGMAEKKKKREREREKERELRVWVWICKVGDI